MTKRLAKLCGLTGRDSRKLATQTPQASPIGQPTTLEPISALNSAARLAPAAWQKDSRRWNAS
jgi:hypothetical protein